MFLLNHFYSCRSIAWRKFPLVVLLCILSSHLFAAKPLVITPQQQEYLLGPYMDLIIDAERDWTIDDVRSPEIAKLFTPSTEEVPNLGFRTEPHWVRVVLYNQSDEVLEWLLEFSSPHYDNLKIYMPDAEAGKYSLKEGGDKFPYGKREIDYHNFVYGVSIPPRQEWTIYLRAINEGTIYFPVTLWHPSEFIAKINRELILLGLFNGVLAVIILYNLFLFFSVRDVNYLYYVCYVACFGLFCASQNGLGSEYIWNKDPALGEWIFPFVVGGGLLFSGFFAQGFLHTKDHSPLLHNVIYVLLAAMTIASFWCVLGDYVTGSKIQSFTVLLAAPVYLLCGIISWRSGYTPARFYVIGWVTFLIGAVLYSLRTFAVLPSTFLTEYGVQIGAVAEVVLLSLALADRINFEKRAKYRAKKEALEAAEKADKLKENFMSTISHELRTPMNGIIGSLEIMDEMAKQVPQLGEPLKSAEHSAQHMHSLIDDILCFTEFNGEGFAMAHEPFHFEDQLQETFDYYHHLCDAKSLGFEIEVDPEVCRWFVGDGDRTKKLISHLLDNAVKFTQQGGVSLSIRPLTESIRDGSVMAIRVCVKDTGIGISEEQAGEVYESFRQVDGSSSRKHGGLGIGLAICSSLVNALEGSISYRSNEQGTQFDVVLCLRKYEEILANSLAGEGGAAAESPQEKRHLSSVQPHANATGESSEVHKPDGVYSFLIVEDNPVNQLILSNLLTRMGYGVTTANHGQDAIKMLRQTNFDLIFMDCQMPVMDGYEATTAIRKLGFEMPIVAVTANATETDRLRCFDVGMNDFVSKPVKKGVIAEKISHWLEPQSDRLVAQRK